ncbi:hypothetical protein AVEN_34185-1, partial [Araneus ventricosus]
MGKVRHLIEKIELSSVDILGRYENIGTYLNGGESMLWVPISDLLTLTMLKLKHPHVSEEY